MTHNDDPHERRLARSKADTLGEANRLAQALLSLLERTDLDTAPARDLLRAISKEEQAALLRGHGHIESRRRFKGQSSHPLQERRTVNRIYLDESGKSFPERGELPQIFALGAVAFESDEAEKNYIRNADSLKQEFFGTADMTFHEPHMRKRKGWYRFEGSRSRQREYDAALASLIENSKFVVFGVGVRKAAYREEFIKAGIEPSLPTDAYALAILMLMERYIDYLAYLSTEATPKSIGRVTLESIGPKEDAQHQMDYARLLLDGSRWISDSSFRSWLETGLRFMPKSNSHPIELADMVSREIYEWVRDGCVKEHGRWPLFSKKIYCRGTGVMGKFGVKVFPDADIREAILAHRHSCGALAVEE